MRYIAPILFASAMLAALPACSAVPGAVVPQAGSGMSPFTWTAVPSSAGEVQAEACKNPLYPVGEGATWSYAINGSSSGTLTRTITNLQADSFTDQRFYSTGLALSSIWRCDDGIMALEPDQTITALLLAQNGTPNLHSTDNSGVTIPDNLGPDAVWNQDTMLEGTSSVNGQAVPVSVHETLDCTADGLESVTVPAGMFNALHTDCTFNETVTPTSNSGGTPATTTVTFSAWYAEGVGMVRAAEAVANGPQDTLELTDYKIP